VRWRIWEARAGVMRGFLEVVRELEEEDGDEEEVAEVTSEVVVSRATPAREGRAIVRAARMLGIGRERALFLCRA
jgi:hypothetical protein